MGRDGKPSGEAQGVSGRSGTQLCPIKANQWGDCVLAALRVCVEAGGSLRVRPILPNRLNYAELRWIAPNCTKFNPSNLRIVAKPMQRECPVQHRLKFGPGVPSGGAGNGPPLPCPLPHFVAERGDVTARQVLPYRERLRVTGHRGPGLSLPICSGRSGGWERSLVGEGGDGDD